MPLTDFSIKNAKADGKPRKLSDIDGLYLYISPTGSRLWRMDYRFAGKRKTASFGAYPKVSLAEARERRDGARRLLKDGRDPMVVKQTERARVNGEAAYSFVKVARSWFANRKARWAPDHATAVMTRLESYIFPELGNRSIGDIEPPELLSVLRQVERRPAPSTAKKLLQTCGQIFRFAIAEGHAKRDSSRDLDGALTAAPPVKHRPALGAGDLPTFFARLDDYAGSEQAALALELIFLCMTRVSETCQAEWAEIEGLDGKAPLWRVPASRMKMRREHLIPLSPRALAILRRLKELSGNSRYLLPAPSKTGFLWRQTLINTMYDLGYHGDATVHGFRRTASTILHEKGYPPDWIELALAHKVGGIRGVYNGAAYLDGRREMLKWWGEHLEGCRNVGELVG